MNIPPLCKVCRQAEKKSKTTILMSNQLAAVCGVIDGVLGGSGGWDVATLIEMFARDLSPAQILEFHFKGCRAISQVFSIDAGDFDERDSYVDSISRPFHEEDPYTWLSVSVTTDRFKFVEEQENFRRFRRAGMFCVEMKLRDRLCYKIECDTLDEVDRAVRFAVEFSANRLATLYNFQIYDESYHLFYRQGELAVVSTGGRPDLWW